MEESRETMSFKVTFRGETRRFVGPFQSFSELSTKATSFFKFDEQQLGSLRIQYLDDESDLICISSDEEFREMMRVSQVPHMFLSLPGKRKREDESNTDMGSDCCFQRGKTIRLMKKSGADPEKIKQEIGLWRKQKQERKFLKLQEKLERKQKKFAEKEERVRNRKAQKETRQNTKNLVPTIGSLSLVSSPAASSVSDDANPVSPSVPSPSSEMESQGTQVDESRMIPVDNAGGAVLAIKDGTASRQPKHERKERLAHPLLTEVWDDNTRHLYLDGNNMLFVVPAIRNIVIRGGSHRQTAETRLASLAQHFASASSPKGLEATTLVYDNTPLEYSQEMITVRSARPSFATSDDALVQWSAEHGNPKELLVVTSDKGLQERLFERGVPVMKPGKWFKVVEGILGTELFQTIVTSQ
jgi:rRNA-processing protein FCF1